MVFGEIVEPSSRAFLDDESIDFPEYESPEFRWTNKLEIFSDIDSIVFTETKRINELFEKIILHNYVLVNSLNNCLNLYKREHSLIAVYKEPKVTEDKLTTGQIVEALEPFLKKIKQIYTITSSTLMSYCEKSKKKENLECFVESLSTKNSYNFGVRKLIAPNLISGLGSNIFSYCIYNNLICSSFIFYLNNTPPDSINSKPIIELAKNMCLSPNSFSTRMTAPIHNLYM
ncbi:hypothetical protein WA026_018142 [Henosepilachna vigintioctopunctata]|uniref:Proteasome assembly chaperone 1 n=1 Tax=Henosepilachna vigintioctopunctata TaxID=420089 RepID=A0AAW1UH07_9CUCU